MRRNTVYKILLNAALLAAAIAPLSAQETTDAPNEIEAAARLTEPLLVDEFGSRMGDCAFSARLDNLVAMLQNHPNAKAHFIIYNGQNVLPSEYDSERFAARTRNRIANYLVQNRGVAPETLIFVNGGFRGSQTIQIWIVPEAVAPPQPTDLVAPPKLPKGKTYLYDQHTFYTDEAADFMLPSPEETETAVEPATDAEVSDETIVQPEAAAANEVEEYKLSAEELEELRFGWVNKDFAAAIKREKGARGRIVYYADDQIYDINKFHYRLSEGVTKLATDANVSLTRFEIVFGGYRNTPECEMWIVPPKGKTPKFAPEERPTPEPETTEVENNL